MNEFWRRLAEGGAPWGTVDVTPASRGLWRRVRLIVYPPGTTRAERRALRFAHSWPIAGALTALVAMVLLAGAWPPVLGLCVLLLLYLAGFWVGARLTRLLRGRVKSIIVSTVSVGGELKVYGDGDLLRSTMERLDALEKRRLAGRVDPVAYEAEWAEVYDALPGGTPVAVRRR
ncbi:DUF6611 family protein [Leifsonia poae]|uniref:DUF6611 family protein n=1 Tax=Leifsonia poae TaxID=110933 RepID=UPI001CC14733|nr:DUF6611 family protein [Leifsonia poae]